MGRSIYITAKNKPFITQWTVSGAAAARTITLPFVTGGGATYNCRGEIVDKQVDKTDDGDDWTGYIVKYENIPEKFEGAFYLYNFTSRMMRPTEIKYFSKNKNDCETFLDVKKYNL